MPTRLHLMEQLTTLLSAAAGLLPAALVARLLYHRRLVHQGRRRMWSWELAWELPTATFCAVLAGGVGEWLALAPLSTHALAGVMGWLGPKGLEAILFKRLDLPPAGPDQTTEKGPIP